MFSNLYKKFLLFLSLVLGGIIMQVACASPVLFLFPPTQLPPLLLPPLLREHSLLHQRHPLALYLAWWGNIVPYLMYFRFETSFQKG
jgi:hypothetical protein